MEGFKVKDEPMDALAIDSQVMVNSLYETAARYKIKPLALSRV